jgi:hypothetical protein
MSDQLGMIRGRDFAGNRFADALLRSLGATQITLRINDPSSGDTGSQIGLEPTPSEDLQIYPAMARALPPGTNGERRLEVVLSAVALKPIAKTYGVEDIVAWLRAAQGIVHYGQLMHIEEVGAEQYFGSDCLYRLTITE